jgi:hypothetical protein
MFDPVEWMFLRSTEWITVPDRFIKDNELIEIAIKIYKKDLDGAKQMIDQFSNINPYVVHDLVMLAKIHVKDTNIDQLILSLIDRCNDTDVNYYNIVHIAFEERLNSFIDLVRFVLNDYNRLNDLLSKGNKLLSLSKLKDNIGAYNIRIQCNLDPYMLDDDNYNIYFKNWKDRLGGDKSYLEHKKTFDKLKYYIQLPDYSFLIKNIKNKNVSMDYSKQSKPLFWHNGILYYGDQKKVYDSILFLKESADMLDFSGENITLGGSFGDPLPPYLINIYIDSCHTGSNNLKQIAPGDIIQFIKFIDQYPTQTLSIDKLELKIVEYFEHEDIKCGSDLNEICDRYKLKLLYMYLHNQKIDQP